MRYHTLQYRTLRPRTNRGIMRKKVEWRIPKERQIMQRRSRFARRHDNKVTFDFDKHIGQYVTGPSLIEVIVGKILNRIVVTICKVEVAVRRIFADS